MVLPPFAEIILADSGENTTNLRFAREKTVSNSPQPQGDIPFRAVFARSHTSVFVLYHDFAPQRISF
jgi:hypothetical protein